MGIRSKMKRRAKLALKYVVDWVIDEDLSSVGVPPQQPQSKKEPVQENTVSDVASEKPEDTTPVPTDEVAQEEVNPTVEEDASGEESVAEAEENAELEVENEEASNETDAQEPQEQSEEVEESEEPEESGEDSSSSSSEEDSSSEEASAEENKDAEHASQDDAQEDEDPSDENDEQDIVEEEVVNEDSSREAGPEEQEDEKGSEAVVEKDSAEEKPELSPEEKKAQAAAKHLAKTKKGLVQKVSDLGGATTLPELHDYSEKKFFVGHKRFSDLMEEMIAEELISFSYEDSAITLGAKAKDFLS